MQDNGGIDSQTGADEVVRSSDFGGHVLDLVVIAGETEINNLELTIGGGLQRKRKA
jgi:hypothetical protein